MEKATLAARNEYVPGHAASHVQHHEWRTAENSAGHLIPRLKAAAEQNPHLTLLDVGAGSGTISVSLARYMPQGQVTATDISDEILGRAKAYSESQGVTNISFQRASVFQLPFDDGSFDITHAHQVLCHLSDPVDAVREMLRVTKPGGTVSLRESDSHMWSYWPELPALIEGHERGKSSRGANGGQEKAGRQLVSWAMKAGVARSNIDASFGTWCYSTPSERQIWANSMAERLRSGPSRDRILQLGLATEDELATEIEAWYEWRDTEDATLGIVNGQVLVTKS